VATQSPARSAGARTPAPAGRRGSAEVRRTAPPLLGALIVLWALMSGIGYLLTHHLRGTAFERWDASVSRRLARNRTDAWNTITHWLTYLGETITVIAICAVFFVALRFALGRWRESMFLAIALSGQALIFFFTQLTIERQRPPVPHLDSSPPTASFPSGHMSAAVTMYVSLAIVAFRLTQRSWLRACALAVALAAPLCVAFARLYRGMHYLTDLSASVLFAALWLIVTWAVILRGLGFDRGGGRMTGGAAGRG
jgi:membrane-associated phospholipid phosphatase